MLDYYLLKVYYDGICQHTDRFSLKELEEVKKDKKMWEEVSINNVVIIYKVTHEEVKI